MGKFFRLVRFIYSSFKTGLARVLGSFCSARAVVVSDGRLLAVSQGVYLELPGGQVKYGEKPEEAVRRELEEETGVEIADPRKITEVAREGTLEIVYRADPRNTELKGSWEGEPVWVPLDEVEEHTWHFHDDIESILQKATDK